MTYVPKFLAVLLLVVCSSAWADPPVANPFAPGRSIHIHQGETAAFEAQLIEDCEHARREWNSERAAGELAKLKEDEGKKIISVPVLIGIIATTMAVSVAVTISVEELAHKKP